MTFDRIAAFAVRPAATLAIGCWAAAEAVVLPIVPDVGLCLLVLAAPRQAVRLFLVVVAGALVGTWLLASLTSAAPAGVESMLLRVPGIDAPMLAGVDAALGDRGVAAFGQLGAGAPLKVYAFEWLQRDGDLAGLLAGAVLNRLTRIGPGLAVAAVLGWRLGGWFRARARPVLIAYALGWIVFYAVYLT